MNQILRLSNILYFQCNPGVGLKAFFDMVHIDPKKLILFGAACSPVTDQIAKAAKHWNLVQVSCGSKLYKKNRF